VSTIDDAHPRLLKHVHDLAPGTALEVGCGDGALAVWLAERGWRVTGVDADLGALERARRYAGEAGVADRTTWVRAGEGLPGGADLVCAHDASGVRTLAAAVRQGGTLLVVGDREEVAEALGGGWETSAEEGVVRAQRTHSN
jgi:SAM-dependent methyltransferase